MGPLGEMGPLDVQIVKADEMDEEKSGLTADAAFEKLQKEAFKLFYGFVKDMASTDHPHDAQDCFRDSAPHVCRVDGPDF